MTPRVPFLARAILALVLHPDDRRYALADLEEELEQRARRDGERRARRWYRGQVLRSLAPALRHRAFRSIVPAPPSPGSMLRRFTMLGLLTDFRVAVRNQLRSPITALVTVLSLGLGIGAVTVTLVLFHQLVLPAPAGLVEPERLVTIYTSREDGEPYGTSSWPDAESLRDGVPGLEDVAAVSVRSFTLGEDTALQPVLAEEVSGNYFAVTGIRPVLGRAIERSDGDRTRSDRIAVLGDRLWRSRFGADPGVVGSTVTLQGHSFVVIGVAPRGIRSRQVPLQPDVWVPLATTDEVATSSGSRFEQRNARGLLLVARMTESTGIDAVRAQVTALGSSLAGDFPEAWTDPRGEARSFTVVSEKASRLNPRATAVLGAVGLFFLAATSLVLLIGCANAASLFLARAAGRSQEIAVRRSLGASRSRLARLWLIDGLLPGLASGMVALGLTWALRRALGSLSLPLKLPFNFELEIGPSAFGLVVILSVGASILFAVVPTLIGARSSLVVALKGETSSHRSGGRLGPRQLLVGGQCAAAVLLVIGAALFARSLQNAAAIDLGVSSDDVAVTSKRLDPSLASETGLARYREIVERLRTSPTVQAAAIGRSVELTMLQMGAAVEVVGDGSTTTPDLVTPQFFRNSVTPGYLELLGVPLLRGRTIAPSDRAGTRPVAVINETFAERLWPGQDAIGRTFTMISRNLQGQAVGASGERFEVVGVARDGKYLDFDDGPLPYFWTALEQDYSPSVAVLVKSATDIDSVVPELRAAVPLDPGEIRSIEPAALSSLWSLQFLHLRVASRVLAWAGAFGLFLATLGIYGTVALAVTQRRRELALRLAIGAGRRQVIYQVVRGSLGLVGGGLMIGLVLAVLLANLLRSVLVGVGPLDPLALVAGVALLSLTAVVASTGPVIRATGIDPASALREE